MAELNQKKNN